MTYYEPPFERGPGALTRTLELLVRFWYLTVPLTVAGVLVGAGLSTLVPTTYTAEVRLGVGGQTLDAQTVPGFVFASEELAATYARYVDEASATGRLQEQVGVETAESVTDISASPIPESSIIVIEVEGTDADDVQAVAQALADALVEQVSGGGEGEDAQAALAEFQELSAQVAQQQVRVQTLQGQLGTAEAQDAVIPQAPAIEALRAELATAQAELSVLTLRQEEAGDRYRELSGQREASLSVVRPAEVVADDGTTRMLVWGVLGLGVGVGVALLVASQLARRQKHAPAVAGEEPASTTVPDDETERWQTDDHHGSTSNGASDHTAYDDPPSTEHGPGYADDPRLEDVEPVPGSTRTQRHPE